MMMVERFGNGVYRQTQQIIHKLGAPFKSPERQMKSGSGWYTFFADHWVWIYKRKGKFSAIIEGVQGETTECSSMEALDIAIRRKVEDVLSTVQQ